VGVLERDPVAAMRSAVLTAVGAPGWPEFCAAFELRYFALLPP